MVVAIVSCSSGSRMAAAIDGTRTPTTFAYPVADGWNRSVPNMMSALAEKTGPSRSPSDTARPPAETTATVWARARLWPCQRAYATQWLGDGADGAKIGNRSDDDVAIGLDEPAHGDAEASRRQLPRHAMGDVVRPDDDDGDVRLERQASVDLLAQVFRAGADDGLAVDVHRRIEQVRQADPDESGRRLVGMCHAVADRSGVAEDQAADGLAGQVVAVDAVGTRWPLI